MLDRLALFVAVNIERLIIVLNRLGFIDIKLTRSPVAVLFHPTRTCLNLLTPSPPIYVKKHPQNTNTQIIEL